MKHLVSILITLVISSPVFAQSSLNGIEGKIAQAFGASFGQASDSPLQDVITEIEKNADNTWATYWMAHAKINQSIYQMNAPEKDMEKAQSVLNEAIDLLENKKNRNTEENTLLARALGINISFNPSQAMNLSSKAGGLIKKAIKENDKNMRAYLQAGTSDFYRPVEYGGGKVAEEHFLKALSLPNKAMDDELAPTWGKDEVYYMLVSFYLREEQYDKAKLFLNKGLKEFPQNHQLQTLSAKI
ncbi:tetratricopeptide repeat protein [Flexithrix dorotheae]|uniref:tetratricopeptide repeat protein n=1 Tax=Flexithrix dorotheae TaxID=70993 RepID=UPI00037D11C5|nr:tetratricopeptide repeat protein [Flexithrix dorotheae]